MSVNKVLLIGRVGADPDMKSVGTDSKVCNFSVATTEKWNTNGQAQERTEWHRVNVWGRLADICAKYISKGMQVYIEGQVQTRSYEKNGQKMYATSIRANNVQFLSSNKNSNQSATDSNQDVGQFGPEPSFDDHPEIPF